LTDFVKKYNSEAYNTTWASFPTAAQNADGSLGTADGTSVTTHPIDTRVVAVSQLSRSPTQVQLVAGVTLLNQLINFFGNTTVTSGNYTQNVDDLAS
jgi:hypothetical protein